MLESGSGGSPAAAAQVVQLTLDGVRSIGTRLGALEADASATSSQFAGTPLDATMFGHSPGGQALAHTHRNAHDVFQQTLRGVLKDLQTFQDRLLKTVDEYEARDGDAKDALTALAQRQHGAPSAAEQEQQQALGRHPDLPAQAEDAPGHTGTTGAADAPGAARGGRGSGGEAQAGAAAPAVPSVPAPAVTHGYE